MSNWGMNSIKGKKRNCPDLMTREGQHVVVCPGNRKLSMGNTIVQDSSNPGHGSQTCSTDWTRRVRDVPTLEIGFRHASLLDTLQSVIDSPTLDIEV